jgi:pyrroline-5-carboxylate reductase
MVPRAHLFWARTEHDRVRLRPVRRNLAGVTRLALLGGGRMGAALVGGLLDAGFAADDICVAELDAERRREIETRFAKVRVVPSAAWAVGDADVVVVAVKPGDVVAALEAALPALADETLVLSIAAGVTIATLESAVPGRPVVRAMPNTPALVGRGASAIAPGTHATDAHLELAEQLLASVGIVVRLDEKHLDAVTGLSGSGPAYIFLVAESLIEAGVLVGLSRPIATDLVVQTLLGSAALLAEGDDGPEALRAAVTSPAGTTAAGLHALETAGVRAAFLDAVAAATRRSQELGGSAD